MSIQRWGMAYTNDQPDPDGKWVRYDDHAAALAEAYTLMGGAIESAIEAEQPRTLTADDPEPAVGSVVLDKFGDAWQRSHTAWLTGDDLPADWTDLTADYGPLRLIHDGGQAQQDQPEPSFISFNPEDD